METPLTPSLPELTPQSSQSPQVNQQLSQLHLYKLGMVYDAIAKLMPLEGRDFIVKVTVSQGDKLSVAFEARTELGAAFTAHCTRHLKEVMEKDKR